MISRIAKINNDFLKYALYRIYALKSQMVIMIMCGVLSFPLIAFALSLHLQNMYDPNYHQSGINTFLGVSMFVCIAAAAVFALLVYTAGVNCYDYYNRRERVDLSWSLPIKNRDRFWGDFASGLVPLALTYIISAAVGLLIARLGFPDSVFYGAENSTPVLSMVAAGMFGGLLVLISVFIIAVFCAAICGRVYETIAYPALIMIIIPALIGLFGTLIFNNVWQIYIFEQLETVLAGTSPGGFMVVLISELAYFPTAYYNFESTLSEHLTFLNPAIIIPFILINAGFLTSAYFLAKRRGAEKTGSAFVFKGAHEIILTLVIFCITSLFFIGTVRNESFDMGTIVGLIMCTAIAYLVLDITAKRGFKKMGRAGIKYAAMLVSSVVIVNLLLIADGFGVGKYVPKLENIESVHLDITHLDNLEFGMRWWNSSDLPQVEFTDKEAIELIRQIHIGSNENPRNYDFTHFYGLWTENAQDSDFFRQQQEVTYTLKNGDTVTRNVRLTFRQIESLLPLTMTDDFKNSQLAFIDDWFAGKERTELSAQVLPLTNPDAFGIASGSADTLRLYEAFKADYLAETFEQRFHSTERVLGKLEFSFSEVIFFPDGSGRTYNSNRTGINVHIFAHYTNLIAELERQGFDLSVQTVGSDDEISDRDGVSLTIFKVDYIGANESTSLPAPGSSFHLRFEWDERTAELVNTLMGVMQPSYMVNGEGYMIMHAGRSVFASCYVIPPEYNHLAEELHRIAVSASFNRNQQYFEEWEDYDEIYYAA
jgi:hypothetical protein